MRCPSTVLHHQDNNSLYETVEYSDTKQVPYVCSRSRGKRRKKKEKGKRNKERGWEPKSSENGKVENRKKNGFLCPAHSDSKVNSD